jgi:branched-chain amino acid transport system substrate-binding protein
MKKIMAVLLTICIGALTLRDAIKNENTEPGSGGDTVLKIGVLVPFSGENSAEGRREALGIVFAHTLENTVELGGKTYTVELVLSDSASSAAAASAAAYGLIGEGCDIVLGSNGSDVTAAAADILANSGVGLLGASGLTLAAESQDNVFDIGCPICLRARCWPLTPGNTIRRRRCTS